MFVHDGARVHPRQPIGLGSALPDFHRPGSSWGCRAGSVTEGRPALWSPARVERARPFSGSSTGGAGMAVLWFLARAERGLEEERCIVAGERRGGGGQRREEKKTREEKSVAWRKSTALLQAREEEEEDRGEKRREERS